MKQYSIDRFEGGIAVLIGADGTLEVSRADLPEDAREGSIVRLMESGWTICADETDARRERLSARRKRLLEGKA